MIGFCAMSLAQATALYEKTQIYGASGIRAWFVENVITCKLQGPGLHGVQLSIAQRAFDLLKPGGRIVYSTCSMNPVEDEAVLATLLRKFKGRLQLVDVSSNMTELKRRPGIYSWRIMDRDGKW